MADSPSPVVEIKPEVVFLYEILQEVTQGRIQIPRFQRAFVWRPDQMTELLDSIYKQYPIGSLLVWETDEEIATLERLGPFAPVPRDKPSVGYLLDGHQRLMTLVGALLSGNRGQVRESGVDGGKWDMYWNVRERRFQHAMSRRPGDVLFPMTSLLDTLKFFDSVDQMRGDLGREAHVYINDISALARTFQSYRVPVIRIRQTGLSEAVEIFARLNSKGQAMSADQMVSALTFRQNDAGATFDLASEIDTLVEFLALRDFGDVDRRTLLRAILATLDEDIYRTDWTKFAHARREDLQERLEGAVERTRTSLGLALNFLNQLGVVTGRLLPYGLQLVLLSAFFDKQPAPTPSQLSVLRRWFWVSSFSAWFGGANPSRISALIREFRDVVAVAPHAHSLDNFDLDAEALPFPTNFDMRSARTRTLLLVMLHEDPIDQGVSYRAHAIDQLARQGPAAVGPIYWTLPKEVRGNPANRLFRPPSAPSGALIGWVNELLQAGDKEAMYRAGFDVSGVSALIHGDALAVIRARENVLTRMETRFQTDRGVSPSRVAPSEAPLDTGD